MNVFLGKGSALYVNPYYAVALFIVNGTPTHYEDNEGSKRYSEPHIIVPHHMLQQKNL